MIKLPLFLLFNFFFKNAKHKNACISKTMLDRAISTNFFYPYTIKLPLFLLFGMPYFCHAKTIALFCKRSSSFIFLKINYWPKGSIPVFTCDEIKKLMSQSGNFPIVFLLFSLIRLHSGAWWLPWWRAWPASFWCWCISRMVTVARSQGSQTYSTCTTCTSACWCVASPS